MQPFKNIRVIDLTHVIAGPFCTYQLAVLGADVIKIEPVDRPDMVREDGADPEQSRKQMGSAYITQNANKRAIAIDLKSESGRDILLKLIKSADVLVENFRTGALDKLGLGYAAVRKIRPDIIYCSMTGYGQQGPLSDRTAYDNVIQAISGLMASTGMNADSAVKVGPPVLDYGTGIQAAFAIAAALFQRANTGQGQRIDIAMQDAAIMLSGTNITTLQACGKPPSPSGNSSISNAGYGCFETSDGQLMLGASTGEQLYNAWIVLGDEEHGRVLRTMRVYELARFIDNDRARMAEIFLTASADQWEQRFNAARVPAARVRSIAETMSHPQLSHRGVLQDVSIDGRTVKLPTAAFMFEHDGPKLHSAPPEFAQHTDEVLQQAGYSESEINRLRADKVVY